MNDDYPMPPLTLVRDALRWCRCCPECAHEALPCQGSLITGVCDGHRCSCDDEPEDDERMWGWDDEPDPTAAEKGEPTT